MTITILAVTFLLITLAVAFVGFRGVIMQGKAPEEINTEKCSLCRGKFHKTQLVERQVGDSRMFYFCAPCIASLHNELVSKN